MHNAHKATFVGLVSLIFLLLAQINGQGHLLDKPVTELYLKCLCEASSGCNATVGCTSTEEGTCGLFAITWAQWVDSGKLTVNDDRDTSELAFINCANDPICAAHSMQNYMKKFNQDCNDDDQMDCLDYARIHYLGPYNCRGEMPYQFQATFNKCIHNYRKQGHV